MWWITADEPALIADQFAGLELGLGWSRAMTRRGARAGPRGAARGRSVVVIFHSADATDGIRTWLPAGPFRRGPGHVIITTRRGGFGSLGMVLDLEVMGS